MQSADRYAAEIGAAFAVVGTVVGWLPIFAAMLACVWYIIVIWESETLRRMTGRLKDREHVRRNHLGPSPFDPDGEG